MSAEYPPFMFGYGVLPTIFAKIQDREAPETFTHDYLRYTLGFSRESDRAFIALAKRIGLLTADGKPTTLYRELLKPKLVQAALAKAMQSGFAVLYARNANVHQLDRKDLGVLVAELTGLEAGHATARAIVGTFLALRDLASPRAEVKRVADRRKVAERRQGR
ncbi:MAG: DUF5343 domain-containing protein [Betaproteobacteria bacterium]